MSQPPEQPKQPEGQDPYGAPPSNPYGAPQPPPNPYGAPPQQYGQPQPYGQQPPQQYGPPQPYGQPGYAQPAYGQPLHQPPSSGGSKTVWIVLGVIGVVIILFCGGCLAVGGLFANEVDNAIDEEIRNSEPHEIGLGSDFEHDNYTASEGWTVAKDDVGLFAIEGLAVANEDDGSRSPFLTFTVYEGNLLVGTITCSGSTLAPGDAAELSCFSGDEYQDFETIKVADSY